jgi:hypothetical protein
LLCLLLLCLLCPATAAAEASQEPEPPVDRGSFAGASFEAFFRKYLPPETPFSPFYSWDAHMAVDVPLARMGPGTVSFTGTFQTVGTENLGSRVSVGGTGYLLGLDYAHAYSDELTLSGGYAHLSSHLTRDLDDKVEEETDAGRSIPVVDDPSEYNVVFFEVSRRVPAWPFRPEFRMIVAPVNFRFSGTEDPGYIRPVYLGTQFTVWRGMRRAVVAATEHEIGKNAFHSFSLSLALYPGTRQDERFHLFGSVTPGRDLHVSPHVGGIRGGIAFGIRMRFHDDL